MTQRHNAADRLLERMLQLGASSFHLDPTPTGYRARFRRGGPLSAWQPAGAAALPGELLLILKLRAGLDVHTARPQRGLLVHRRPGRRGEVAFDVSTLPAHGGEALTLEPRAPTVDLTLGQVGLDPSDRLRLEALLDDRPGLIAVCGRSRAGKRTLLRACAHRLATAGKVVYSIVPEGERPLDHPDVVTLKVRETGHFTRVNALHAAANMGDPDAVHIDRLVDGRAIDRAFRFAAGGSAVLAGLPSGDADLELATLLDRRDARFHAVDALRAVVTVVRLPRLCAGCRIPGPAPDVDVLAEMAPRLAAEQVLPELEVAYARPRPGTPCDECDGAGSRGDLFLYELVVLDADTIRQLLARGPDPVMLRARTRSLRERALLHAAAGDVTVAHALRAGPALRLDAPGTAATSRRCRSRRAEASARRCGWT